MSEKQNNIRAFYDVLIVGAGPAGATAARELVKKGYKVLIIERKKLPRYKICSGLIKVVKRTGCTGTDMGLTGNFFLGKGRVLVAGEAAGFMNIFGEGISSAIATGNLATTAIDQAQTSKQDVLSIYEELTKPEETRTQQSWDIANMILGRDFLPQ